MQLEKAFKYRNVWMGLAAILVLWFHSTIILPGRLFWRLKELSYGGVDIFVFASGIGCFYSLAKNDNSDEFLRRRLARIFPTYWCFISLWLLYKLQTSKMPFTAVIGNVLAVQNFSGQGNEFDWYTGAISLFYLCAPYLYGMINRMKSWKESLGIVMLLVICSFVFWGNYNWIIVMTRLPIFFVGMVFGKFGKDGEAISKAGIGILAGVSVIGIILLNYFDTNYGNYGWIYGLSWYPFILIVPGVCITISYCLELLKDNIVKKCFVKVMSCIGKYSFEVYLVHILLFDLYGHFFVRTGIVENRMRYQLCIIVLTIPCCILLNKSAEFATRMVCGIGKKCKAC